MSFLDGRTEDIKRTLDDPLLCGADLCSDLSVA